MYWFTQEISETAAKIHGCFGLIICLKEEKSVQGKPCNVEETNASKPFKEQGQSKEIQQKDENHRHHEDLEENGKENCSRDDRRLQTNWEMQIGSDVFWVYIKYPSLFLYLVFKWN